MPLLKFLRRKAGAKQLLLVGGNDLPERLQRDELRYRQKTQWKKSWRNDMFSECTKFSWIFGWVDFEFLLFLALGILIFTNFFHILEISRKRGWSSQDRDRDHQGFRNPKCCTGCLPDSHLAVNDCTWTWNWRPPILFKGLVSIGWWNPNLYLGENYVFHFTRNIL